jgi:hypothetical protein
MAVGKTAAKVQYLLDVADADLSEAIDNSVLAQIMAKSGDVSGFSSTTDSLEALAEALAAIPVTAQRGTDNAFLAAVGGALADAAATGAVSDAKTMMGYIKQLVTAIQLIPTTAMRGTDGAALASVLGAVNTAAATGAVNDTSMAMAYLKQLVTAVALIPTTAMRGTDNAALATTTANDEAAIEHKWDARPRPYPYDTGVVFSCTSHATEVNTFPVAYTSLIPETTFAFGDTPDSIKIAGMTVESMDTNAVYVLEFYRSPVGDASYTPVGAVRFNRTSVQVRSFIVPLEGREWLTATEHLWARLKSTPANTTVTFSVSVKRHISTSVHIAASTGVWPLG